MEDSAQFSMLPSSREESPPIFARTVYLAHLTNTIAKMAEFSQSKSLVMFSTADLCRPEKELGRVLDRGRVFDLGRDWSCVDLRKSLVVWATLE